MIDDTDWIIIAKYLTEFGKRLKEHNLLTHKAIMCLREFVFCIELSDTCLDKLDTYGIVKFMSECLISKDGLISMEASHFLACMVNKATDQVTTRKTFGNTPLIITSYSLFDPTVTY